MDTAWIQVFVLSLTECVAPAGFLDVDRFRASVHGGLECLDCHTDIPIADGIYAEDLRSAETETDRAAIQNLPRIENCQECHEPRQASNRCVTCHYFHPNKSRRSELLLYLDTDEGRNRAREDASQTFLQGG